MSAVEFDQVTAGELLAALHALRHDRTGVLDRYVEHARVAGIGWMTIGASLGLSRQGAHYRYRHLSSPPSDHRFPVEPLLRLVEISDGATSHVQLAERAGSNTETLYRSMRRGGFTAMMADQWACALGFHPSEVWGDLWWAGTGLEPTR